jgi:hypothetical protein
MRKLIATLAVVAALAVAAPAAGALESGNTPDGGPKATTTQPHRRLRHLALRIAAHAAASELGVQVSDLRTAVQSGQSIAAFAESKGKSAADVQQAIEDALNAAIDRAASKGRIDADRAAKLHAHVATAAGRIVNFVPGAARAGGAATT